MKYELRDPEERNHLFQYMLSSKGHLGKARAATFGDMFMPKSHMQSNSSIKTVSDAVEAVFHCGFCHCGTTSNIFTVWHLKLG